MLSTKYWYLPLLLFISEISIAQIPKVLSGKIVHLENVSSKFVSPRNVDVWLPDGYDAKTKYPVLYMHDGMALFDTAIMWNKQAWRADEVLGKLIAENKIRKCIVVGVWNGGAKRFSEYFPQKPFEALPVNQQDSLYAINNHTLFTAKVQSNNYLKFLVYELKPYIDSHFHTLTTANNTFIAGSSMGALISLYAICEYPHVFGGAACLSTHWPGIFTNKNNPVPAAFMAYLKKNLPRSKSHKIYFDHGSKTLDSLYKPLQQQADAVMKLKGYTSKSWITKEFIGADHSENSWHKRFDVPVVFLLGTKN